MKSRPHSLPPSTSSSASCLSSVTDLMQEKDPGFKVHVSALLFAKLHTKQSDCVKGKGIRNPVRAHDFEGSKLQILICAMSKEMTELLQR